MHPGQDKVISSRHFPVLFVIFKGIHSLNLVSLSTIIVHFEIREMLSLFSHFLSSESFFQETDPERTGSRKKRRGRLIPNAIFSFCRETETFEFSTKITQRQTHISCMHEMLREEGIHFREGKILAASADYEASCLILMLIFFFFFKSLRSKKGWAKDFLATVTWTCRSFLYRHENSCESYKSLSLSLCLYWEKKGCRKTEEGKACNEKEPGFKEQEQNEVERKEGSDGIGSCFLFHLMNISLYTFDIFLTSMYVLWLSFLSDSLKKSNMHMRPKHEWIKNRDDRESSVTTKFTCKQRD